MRRAVGKYCAVHPDRSLSVPDVFSGATFCLASEHGRQPSAVRLAPVQGGWVGQPLTLGETGLGNCRLVCQSCLKCSHCAENGGEAPLEPGWRSTRAKLALPCLGPVEA